MNILSALVIVFVGIQECRPQITPKLAITQIPTDFQWCKKSECLTKGYKNFYNVNDLKTVQSGSMFEIHMGLWATFKLFILLAPGNKQPIPGEPYYYVELLSYNDNVAKQFLFSRIVKSGNWYLKFFNFPFQQTYPWSLTSTEFRPFFVRVTDDDIAKSRLIEFGSDDKIIMSYLDDNVLSGINYVSFSSAPPPFEAKVFFECPLHNVSQNLPKHVVLKMNHLDMPTCNKCDQCPSLYFPVCASNLKTYRNECLFRCQVSDPKIKVINKGVCMHWRWEYGSTTTKT